MEQDLCLHTQASCCELLVWERSLLQTKQRRRIHETRQVGWVRDGNRGPCFDAATVWSLGFRVSGLEFGVQGLWVRLYGLGFRVKD